MEYNGYPNKPTWLVNIWKHENLDAMAGTSEGVTPENIQAMVEDLVDEQIDQYGLVRELIECALADIDYAKLAELYQQEDAAQ